MYGRFIKTFVASVNHVSKTLSKPYIVSRERKTNLHPQKPFMQITNDLSVFD